MNQSFSVASAWLRSLSLCILVLAVAVACSKNDDASPTTTTSLEGNWKANSLKLGGTVDVLPSLTATYGTCLTDITLSFKAGGAVSYDNPASCSASAASIATLSTTTGIDANSKWSQSGNVLTITPSTSPNTPKSFTTVFGSSSTTVQLQGSGVLPVPGTSTTVNSTFTLELRKI